MNSKRYALKGVNDDQNVCLVCGKVELKRVMWIVEIDADGNEVGQPFHCGTTCGAKLLGRSASALNTACKNFSIKVASKRNSIEYAYMNEHSAYDLLEKLHNLHLSFSDRLSHPLYHQYEAIEADAKAFAASQAISIEL